jgi:hypothetical protein
MMVRGLVGLLLGLCMIGWGSCGGNGGLVGGGGRGGLAVSEEGNRFEGMLMDKCRKVRYVVCRYGIDMTRGVIRRVDERV